MVRFKYKLCWLFALKFLHYCPFLVILNISCTSLNYKLVNELSLEASLLPLVSQCASRSQWAWAFIPSFKSEQQECRQFSPLGRSVHL